jgi:hypothetical protein
MSAIEALDLAEAFGVEVGLAGDRIHYRSRGAAPAHVLAALKAAKPDIVALLAGYTVDASGALASPDDGLLAALARLNFKVRRYGAQAALDDDGGQGRAPPIHLLHRFAEKQTEYGLALRALRAPHHLEGSAHPPS